MATKFIFFLRKLQLMIFWVGSETEWAEVHPQNESFPSPPDRLLMRIGEPCRVVGHGQGGA